VGVSLREKKHGSPRALVEKTSEYFLLVTSIVTMQEHCQKIMSKKGGPDE
jgi:hypothetical protein